MTACDVAKRRENGVFVVRIIGQLPTHRRMFRGKSRTYLPPTFTTVFTPINATANPSRLVPILWRTMATRQKHRCWLARQIDHIVKIVTFHSFLGSLPSHFRGICSKKPT